jgi:hypothetical protein
MFSLLSFGKKKRSRRSRKSARKGAKRAGAKPPSRLLKICRKYKIKATRKVGSKRVYKPVSVLRKSCLKKVRAAMKAAKRRSAAFGARRRMVRRSTGFGNKMMSMMKPSMGFGKRGRSRKVSKAAAMKAFRQFYKRHCRGSRFGNGGNPPLSASMGYQFCPSGMGGVLGANSTGMFPTPCTSMNQAQAAAESAVALPSYVSSFGRRRTRRRMTSFGKKRKVHRKRSTKRKSTRKHRKVHRRRASMFGRRRRVTRRRSTRRVTRRRRCWS